MADERELIWGDLFKIEITGEVFDQVQYKFKTGNHSISIVKIYPTF